MGAGLGGRERGHGAGRRVELTPWGTVNGSQRAHWTLLRTFVCWTRPSNVGTEACAGPVRPVYPDPHCSDLRPRCWNLSGLDVAFPIFLQRRQQMISTAAPLSGKGPGEDMKGGGGGIASPVQINRPPLNNQRENIPGNGKDLATDLLGELMVVSKRPS